MQYLKTMVGAPNVDDLKNEIKKKDETLAKLREKAKKILEEKDFVSKAYE